MGKLIHIQTNKKFKMYRTPQMIPTSIECCDIYEGEDIEEKCRRIMNNQEPITDGAPIIYTDRKDGVQAQFDIRTDRFELAIEGMDTVNKSKLAKRMRGIEERENEAKIVNMPKDGGPESIGGNNK